MNLVDRNNHKPYQADCYARARQDNGSARLTQANNVTSGRIYERIIAKERRGDYLGKTVQVIPHVTNEIKAAMRKISTDDVDILIVEIGGTVGDIESQNP